ncbi:LysR family transcriptional regulator [Olivibacter sp. SDN3]|uniref:LysR family transcriptional regulator n=1 Tax=Olivibacter sp. SDN3 TaxID=2764720 RepID=UPI0016514396|nr:LysR family transcriptional regulator [Olivibacter sp. SDN3]QNL49059.1 LysR family transcriptional regulator [Olivibacter sp. SDN3]
MTIIQLENFLILAETLNFRKAAEKIFIAQPALSKQIQLLEEEVGAMLFERNNKRVSLTPAGSFFKAESHKLLYQFKQCMRKTALIHEGKAGEIRIGHSSSAMHTILPGWLSYTEKLLPDLKTSLVEGTNELIFNKLNKNEIDFAFVPNAFIPEDVSSITVYREQYALILPLEHRINENNFTGLVDCADENWVLHPQEGHGYMEEILKILSTHHINPKIVHRSPNTSTVLRLVEAGLGVTMMGLSTLKGFNLRIRSIVLKDMPDQLEMRLAWRKNRSEELKAHLQVIQRYLEKKYPSFI